MTLLPQRERWAALEVEIRERLGFVPSFFRATERAEIAEQLWSQARAVYLDGPVPHRFKVELFAYLSRFCAVPYCMIRLAALLQGRGGPVRETGEAGEAGEPPLGPDDVLQLLCRPVPGRQELEEHLQALAACRGPIRTWPEDRDSALARALFACAVHGFLGGTSRGRCDVKLRRVLGSERFDDLVVLLGFVRAAHAWTEAHPDLELEDDAREMLREQPALAAWVERYRDVVAAELETDREIALEEAEGALEESQELSQAVLDTVPDAILTIDDVGTIHGANAATTRLFGYEESELVGQNVRMLMPPPYAEEHDGYLERYRLTGEARIIGRGREVEARRKDGTVFPIRLAVGEAHGEGARHFTGIIHDLSEVRALQRQLLQSQKMEAVGTLAGGVAHDFNNLLTSIRGSSEILIDHLNPTGRLARSARRIQRAADRATALTTRLLAFSRQQATQYRVVDLNEVVRETEEICAHALSEELDQKLDLAGEPLYVRADEGQIGQVLMNLVVNAADAMRGGGCLTVATGRRADGGVSLTVRDTGEGIPAERLERIFEPFFTTKEPGRGTGLGLSTAFAIVREHDGAIDVESEVGVGTAFTVLLPGVAAPPAEVATRAETIERQGRGERILLVEDDDIARDLLVEVLEDAGYAVVATAAPEEALRRARERNGGLDLLVTDVVLPGISGLQLAREVRSQHPQARVLYMSGYTEKVLDEHGGLDGDAAFLRKPFGNGSLLEKLREVLERDDPGPAARSGAPPPGAASA